MFTPFMEAPFAERPASPEANAFFAAALAVLAALVVLFFAVNFVRRALTGRDLLLSAELGLRQAFGTSALCAVVFVFVAAFASSVVTAVAGIFGAY